MPISPDQLPDKLHLCVIGAESGKPVPGIPMRALIGLSSYNSGARTLNLGLLASNHAGYLAFDIISHKPSFTLAPYVADEVTSLVVEIPLDPPFTVDLLPQLNTTVASPLLALTLPAAIAALQSSDPYINSIQNPDVNDWLLSPSSFGSNPTPIIGEDGCEVLLPSHAAERIFRFHQLVRDPSTRWLGNPSNQTARIIPSPGSLLTIPYRGEPSYSEEAPRPEVGWPDQLYYRTGKLHHYELVWFPVNHGLGRVLYSLTLAPCEAVRMAVLDWSRSEEATRAEQTALSDDLTHSLRRDRSVEEVVNAVLRERQSGDSFMGGMAGVGGFGGGFGGGGMGMPMGGGGTPGGGGGAPGGPAGAQGGQGGGQQAGLNYGVTGSHSIGYAMANSSGNRDVDVETTQSLIDEISQASHLLRDLRSTVIVQANQRESEMAQTRIVRNHNHSHALTVLYYEVVRHYLVRTLLTHTQDVVFIKYPTLDFDLSEKTLAFLRKNIRTLQSGLLDSRFADAINDLHLLQNIRLPRVVGLVVNVNTGPNFTQYDRVKLLLTRSNGKALVKRLGWRHGYQAQAFDLVPHLFDDSRSSTSTPWINRLFQQTSSNMFYVDMTYADESAPDQVDSSVGGLSIRPWEVKQVGFVFHQDGDNQWIFNSMTVHAVVEHADGALPQHEFVKILDTTSLGIEPIHSIVDNHYVWDVNFDSASLRVQDFIQRTQRIQGFIDHLQINRRYYNNLIWLNENPNERAVRFANYQFGGVTLIEAIDNRPIDAVGDYLVFARDPLEPDLKTAPKTMHERIISLPTRGAFAESKLSHCNSSEIIDDTRFWDWQLSPCPDEPTEISPITLGPRYQAYDVTPTALPESGVSISEPPDAPEPFGMREVMELLRTPEIFRDMSGIAELGSLLEKLVEVAGEVEKARIGATTELAKARTNPPAETPTRDTPSATPATATSQDERPSPQTTAREQANAMRQIDRVEDPDQRAELTEALAERAVTSVGSPTPRGRSSDSSSSTRAAEQDTSTLHTLNFHFKDHRGRPLGVFGFIRCYDTQTDQMFMSDPIGSMFAGESHGRISGIPSSIRQIRLEFWAEDLYLNVVSSTDLDQLDSLIDGRIRLLSGTRRISVAEDVVALPAFGGGRDRAARLLAQAGEHDDRDFSLDSSDLSTYSFQVQLASETRAVTRESGSSLRSALEGELSGGGALAGATLELTLGGSSEATSSTGSSVTVNAIFTTGQFTFRQNR